MKNNSEPSIGQTLRRQFMGLAAIVAVGMPLSLGLGYLMEEGNKKEAAQWHERLTNSQKKVLQAAADAGECGLINSRVSGLCFYVERGEMTLDIDETQQNVEVSSRSTGPKSPKI